MVKFLIALHVLVAVASIGPLIHAVTTASRAVRHDDGPAATATVRLIRVYSIASVLAVVLGMGLLSMDSPYGNHEKLGSFSQTWIWLSVLLWLAAIGLAHALIVPALRPIAEGKPAGGSVATRVLAIGIVDALLLSAIVFLMIYQPGH